MFNKLSIKQAKDFCESTGVFALNSIRGISLSEYPRFFKIEGAFQDVSMEDVPDLISRLNVTPAPAIPEGCNCSVVLEAKECTMDELNTIFSWATNCLGEDRLQRFEPVIIYDAPFAARITVLCHHAQRRRYCRSEIDRLERLLFLHDIRLARTVDAELDRNREIGAVRTLDVDDLCQIVSGKHLLWISIASTTRSLSDITDRMKPEMALILHEYNVSNLVLFIETDKDTPREEVDALRRRFKRIVGKDVGIRVNLRVKDSFIKTVTCRAVLIGTPYQINSTST